ncbi:hypothetical protein V8G54_012957 [Vigna mungo]|uniref:Tryptophan synthase beta chain-like PALP domain-containing protein n=1 Tax=Vigna mungo TaxID=3915 RepID=A0AAQ3S4C9_VIGMU
MQPHNVICVLYLSTRDVTTHAQQQFHALEHYPSPMHSIVIFHSYNTLSFPTLIYILNLANPRLPSKDSRYALIPYYKTTCTVILQPVHSYSENNIPNHFFPQQPTTFQLVILSIHAYPPVYIGAVLHRFRSDSGGDNMMNALSYFRNILTSKVYDVAIKSPLQLAPKLSRKLKVKVWLKREDLQPVFSFKIRGAYNMTTKLPRGSCWKRELSALR